MKLRTIALMAVALTTGVVLAAGDPDEALQAIIKYRTDTIAQARETGAQINAAELNAKIKEMATDAIKDVDPNKVEAKKAYSWAQLYNYAGEFEEIHMLCEMFQTTKPTEALSFDAHMLCLQAFSQMKTYSMGIETLNEMPLPSAVNAYSATSMAVNVFAPGVAKEKGYEAARKLLDNVAARIPESDENAQNQRYLDMAKAMIVTGHGNLIKEEKGVDAAVRFLEDRLAKEANETVKANITSGMRSMKAEVTRTALIGSMAPMFPVERTIGEFKDFASLKGKVVIIDFFAHWCGPCIASFPDVSKMYAELKGQGLEIVGATTYYGYYKTERNLDKDTEFARMGDFMKDHNMTWPVVYSDRSLFDTYGVTGIPTTFLIGRDGKVHSFHVGYSAESFKEFRAKVEELLKEKH